MVQRHLAERGIKNPRVLEAFRTVPRHRFLPPKIQRQAYDDESIPIGEGQTITPPYDVAFMTEVLDPKPTDKVYEVGTGSGYQSAILSRLVKEVYSVEIHAPLSERATAVHKALGYDNIHTRVGDGYEGWPDAAPFDAIIVTCAPHRIPAAIDRPAQGGGPDGHSPGRPVHPERAPGHQEGRQADRQGAQADAVRADDRQGPEGRAGAQARRGSGPRAGQKSGPPRRKRGRGADARPQMSRSSRRMTNDSQMHADRRLWRAVRRRRCWCFSRSRAVPSHGSAQEPEIERPGPPAVDDLEKDSQPRRRSRRLV